jgi:hypothetical protein
MQNLSLVARSKAVNRGYGGLQKQNDSWDHFGSKGW